MTDRAKAFIVHLDDDYRIGDETTGADLIQAAIAMIKGVHKVEPLILDAGDLLERERARMDLEKRLWKALNRP